MSCSECSAESHQYQRHAFPVTRRVVALREINCQSLEPIPFGAIGQVTGHCADGRAIIVFEGHENSHTFHTPEFSIAAEQTNGN